MNSQHIALAIALVMIVGTIGTLLFMIVKGERPWS